MLNPRFDHPGAAFFRFTRPRALVFAVLALVVLPARPMVAQTYLGSFPATEPTFVALDTVDGVTWLYVSERGDSFGTPPGNGGRILKFDTTSGSTTPTAVASRGTADGQFISPDTLVVDPSTHDLFIADRYLDRVQRITRGGAPVMKWGSGVIGAIDEMHGPVGLARDAAGAIYVTEHGDMNNGTVGNMVSKYVVTGTTATRLWRKGHNLNVPYSTVVSGSTLLVADGFGGQVQSWDLDGNPLGSFPLTSPVTNIITLGLSVDATGALWIAESSGEGSSSGVGPVQQVERRTIAGASTGVSFGVPGGGAGQLQLPFDALFDAASNRVYVADYGNNRVDVFSLGWSALANMSSRLRIAGTDISYASVAGFVIAGSTPRQVLIRGVGPSLAAFGINDGVPDPTLTLYDHGGNVIALNNGWGNDAAVSAAGDAVGAFRLQAGSRDAALLTTLAPGVYSAEVSSANGGMALIEIYDGPLNSSLSPKPLINLSTRGFIGTAQNALMAGFVVAGTQPKSVLIRGIGPGLAGFNVPGYVADPTLKLYDVNHTLVAQNDNWGTPQPVDSSQVPATAAEITAAGTAVGAFPLRTGSADAAIVVTLGPGNYSAAVSGVGDTIGAGLVEVYEIPGK